MGISSETVLRIMEPATEQVLAELPHAGVEETDAAVARAKAAFDGWRAVTPSDRARVLRAIADAITDHAEELAQLETRNVGKPIRSDATAATIAPSRKAKRGGMPPLIESAVV